MLDEMLKGNKTVEEIVEFFRTYQMEGGLSFEPRVYRQSRSSSRQSSVEPEEDLGDKLSFKVKTRDNANEILNQGRDKSNENTNNSVAGSSEAKEITDLHKNEACKSSRDGDCKDTQKVQESQEGEIVDDGKDRGWNNATEKIGKSLFNLDSLVRNVETENRIVEKLTNMSSRQNHESDQDSANPNMMEMMTDKDFTSLENSAPRNVFDLVDADFVKRMIPFMHPKSRNHTFKYFLDKVDEVVETVGEDKLLNSEILDLMQFRCTFRH